MRTLLRLSIYSTNREAANPSRNKKKKKAKAGIGGNKNRNTNSYRLSIKRLREIDQKEMNKKRTIWYRIIRTYYKGMMIAPKRVAAKGSSEVALRTENLPKSLIGKRAEKIKTGAKKTKKVERKIKRKVRRIEKREKGIKRAAKGTNLIVKGIRTAVRETKIAVRKIEKRVERIRRAAGRLKKTGI